MKIALKSQTSADYVAVEPGLPGSPLLGNRAASTAAGAYETFEVFVETDQGLQSVEDALAGFVAQIVPPEPSPAPVLLPPPTPPAPGPVGPGLPPDPFVLSDALQHDGPVFVQWPATTKITRLDFRTDGVHVEFGAQGIWPGVRPDGWTGDLQYCLGMGMSIGGTWHVSAPIQCWQGLDASGGNIGDASLLPRPSDDYGQRGTVAVNWFYGRPSRWGPMSRQPYAGEPIAFFVVAGSVRGGSEAVNLRERSNVVVVPFPGPGGASWSW